jgi:hypothetical protein
MEREFVWTCGGGFLFVIFLNSNNPSYFTGIYFILGMIFGFSLYKNFKNKEERNTMN